MSSTGKPERVTSAAASPTILPTEVHAWIASADGTMLREDTAAWLRWKRWPQSGREGLDRLFFSGLSEFRSLFDYRCRTSQDGKSFAGLFRQRGRAQDLHIRCDKIGPRFIIQHGHSTWVLADQIGSDFLVGQNVTIGSGGGGRRPKIGDRVQVRTGAVVVGNITVADDVVVAPCVFLNRDVPAGSYVFPAEPIIKPRRLKRLPPPLSDAAEDDV